VVFPSFVRQSIGRLRGTETTDHGNTHWTFPTHAEAVTVGGVVVDPVQTREDNINRTATITQYKVLAPPTADVLDTDHFVYRGKEYYVVGEIQFQPSPTGALDQQVFTLELWEG
jgi:hypothetical protein